MAERPADITSKHPTRRGRNEFYRYYAGYPLTFAEWALRELKLSHEATVFDPWNGSGTTVAACAKAGISCRGYDINPVMVHLGRARIACSDDFEVAIQTLQDLNDELGSQSTISPAMLGRRFRELPVVNETAHSVLLTALYPAAAQIYGFDRSKNPSWYPDRESATKRRLDRSTFIAEWKNLISRLEDWSTTNENPGTSLSIERADSRKSFGRTQMFDGILTSPPYLTRIDYVHSTLPELRLLYDFDLIPKLDKLRRSMLGTPLTNRSRTIEVDALPSEVRKTLNQIRRHKSKASSTYYYNFFASYFADLSASLKSISKALKNDAMGCFVVQPSSYKEIEIDLPRLLTALAKTHHMEHVTTVEFQSTRSMALVNVKAHELARRPKHEYAVFLRKVGR